jgi:hypothetical protein
VATRHDRLNSPSRSTPAIRWIAIQGSVTSPGSGALNDPEASAVLAELHRLVIEQGYRGTVGVVTPFRAQANRIRELVEAHPQANVLLDGTQLLVDTVHRFQGDERDVILFSPVISEGITEGAVGFLRKTGNLFNVAITRARAALVVIGDPAAARESGVDYLSAFAAYVDGLTPDSAPSAGAADVDSNGPEYPNVSNPHQVSEWERILYRSLWEKGLRPTPQYPEEKFVLDLALFDGTRKLNIEVDGERYHRDWNGELLRRDQMRNMRMMGTGMGRHAVLGLSDPRRSPHLHPTRPGVGGNGQGLTFVWTRNHQSRNLFHTRDRCCILRQLLHTRHDIVHRDPGRCGSVDGDLHADDTLPGSSPHLTR